METSKEYYYTYYSYEEWGRGYIGSRGCKCLPEEDVKYFGSYRDKTFHPTQKIILEVYKTRQETLAAEIILHDFYDVLNNPHFANQSKVTSTGFFVSKEISIEIGRNNGRKNKELGRGYFSRTKEQRSESGKKGGEKAYELGLGVHSLTSKELSENGKKAYELGVGVHGLTPEQRRENSKKAGTITAEKTAKEFSLISPEGEIVRGRNITKFCRENNLDRSSIRKVLKVTQSHHKGWKRYCELTILDFL